MLRILGFALVVLFPTAVLAAKKSVQLKYSYAEKGRLVCEGEHELRTRDRYQLCVATVDGIQIIVRAKAVPLKDGSIRVSAFIDHIDADGKFIEWSRPRIVALNGETASISVSEENNPAESMTLEVTPTIVDK